MPLRSGLLARRLRSAVILASIGASLTGGSAWAAGPKVEDVLKFQPKQKDVDCDRPTAAEIAKCTLKAEKNGNKTGWVVRDGSGQILRNFVDSNADNIVDLWCYYKDGAEIYRDIDTNFNGKPDQSRWVNTAGTRWGIMASEEDPRIESWKVISAEEASAELVAALRDSDSARFERLLLTKAELNALGLGPQKTAEIAKRVESARANFKTFLKQQKVLTPQSQWAYFGCSRPGVAPAGTDGTEADVTVYENVYVMVETAGKHVQMPIGAMIRSGDTWRIIDTPGINETESDALACIFNSPGAAGKRPDATGPSGSRPTEEAQVLMNELEKLDKEPAREPEEQAKQNARRADIIERLAELNDGDQRKEWLKQLADSICAGAQAGVYPDGVPRLKKLLERVTQGETDDELIAYVQFRFMLSDYAESLRAADADYPKIQKKWLSDLQTFCEAHPKSVDGPEAMLQLANGLELDGQESKAMDWYDKLLKTAPESSPAAKARGAKARLESIGKVFQLKGKGLDGKPVDLANSKFRGKMVLVHYWAAEYPVCQKDIPLLQAILAKYSPNLAIVGVSLDNNPQKLASYLKQNHLPWEQIYEGGGLDSRLANEYGILTFPTMILIDKQGKVVNRSLRAEELDAELGKMNLMNQAAKPKS